MKIKVTASTQELYNSDQVYQVIAPTTDGIIAILPGHIDIVTTLQMGKLEIKLHDKQVKEIILNGGLLQVKNDQIAVLADEASLAEDLIIEEIAEAIQNAEKQLAGKLAPTELIQYEKKLRYERFKQGQLL